MHFRTMIATATALALGLTLVACSSADPETPAPEVTQTQDAAETPTEAAPTAEPEPTLEPVDPRLEVTIGGVTYTGTEEAPLKIGTDTPGQPPALEAGFTVDSEDLFPAGKAIFDQKYLVVVAPRHADDDLTAEGPVVGYSWAVYGLNEYGSYKAISGAGWGWGNVKYKGDPYPTQQAAVDAPKTLGGRELDRSEYVLRAF